MSRIPSNASGSSSTSKFKISAPQPYQPPGRTYPSQSSVGIGLPSGPGSAVGNGNNRGQPSQGTNGSEPRRTSNDIPRPSNGGYSNQSSRYDQSDQYGGGPSMGGGPQSGSGRSTPVRPARSVRRAPNPPGMPSSSQPQRPRPAGVENLNGQSSRQSFEDEQMSTPVSERGATPWETDRSQRTQALDVVQQSSGREDRLKDAVGAFMKAGKGKESRNERSRNVDGGRERGANDADLMMGYGGREFADVDSVLRRIQRDWPTVLETDFSPTGLALGLIDSTPTSSSIPPLREFLDMQSQLASSLQRVVQKHYQTYAGSLPAHATLSAALGQAQKMVKDTKKQLKESRDLLDGDMGGAVGKRGEMATLWNRERTVKEMLKALDVLEQLKKIPDRLDALIAEKRFLQASLVLIRSLNTVNREEMLEVTALSELRAYLTGQRNALADILIEELHNHLYLKSHYCDSRWKSYTFGQTDLTKPDRFASDDEEARIHLDDEDLCTQDKRTTRLSRYLDYLAIKPARNPMLDMNDDDLSTYTGSATVNPRGNSIVGNTIGLGSTDSKPVNPEADSYGYMETLIEGLAVIRKLSYGLEVISQRVAQELFTLVDEVVEDVEKRMEERKAESLQNSDRSLIMDGASQGRPVSVIFPSTESAHSNAILRVSALESSGPPEQAEALRDLFWTTYSKLQAVVEGHRAVYEVVNKITARRDFKDDSVTGTTSSTTAVFAIPTSEIWKPIRSEIRSLLHDYLTAEDRGSTSNRTPIMSVNEVLRSGKIARDRERAMFTFTHTDNKNVDKALAQYGDELNRTLKASVPGLVNTATDTSTNQTSANLYAVADERSSRLGQHRLLIPPNPFNVSILFTPHLAFLDATKDLAPSDLSDDLEVHGSFLDDFVVKIYLPQLEEKVTSLFQIAVSGPEAFQIDLNSGISSPYPLLKSAVQVMAIINSLCVMLSTTPFHKEDYSRLIIGVVVRYYQRCSSHFRDIVVANSAAIDSPLPLSAIWSQREDVVSCLNELHRTSLDDRSRRDEIASQETRMEMSLQGAKLVTYTDLVTTTQKFQTLANLCYSLRWLISKLSDLQLVLDEDPSSGALPDPVTPRLGQQEMSPTSPVLTLSTAMAQRFEAILSTYNQLADMILFTIRIEIRCRVMCYLGSSMSKGNYRVETDELEPEPHALDLTADLIRCHAAITASLPDSDRSFLFHGLGALADQLLVSCGRFVRFATTEGVRKIQRNIAAIQQSFRNVLDEPSEADFVRAKQYWALYAPGPKAMMDNLQSGAKPVFSVDDYTHMLNLQCRVDPRASVRMSSQSVMGGGTSAINAGRVAADPDKNSYNEYFIDLHSLAMEDWQGP